MKIRLSATGSTNVFQSLLELFMKRNTSIANGKSPIIGSIASLTSEELIATIALGSRPHTPQPTLVMCWNGAPCITATVTSTENFADLVYQFSYRNSERRNAIRKALLAATDEITLTIVSLDNACSLVAPNPKILMTRSKAEWFSFFGLDETISDDPRSLSPNIHRADQALPIAFYLPQYHPFSENDKWWGPGFTEWTNVVQNRPLFPGHEAPLVPADLGFYDLRVVETRAKQAVLAKQYGLYGFCYYFYWFNGRRVLADPLNRMLFDGEPDMPFCLCWANETWSRRWDGSEQEILLQQTHSPDADAAIFDDLLPFFNDPNYITIGGRPLLLIYRASLMPDPVAFTDNLRVRARANGFPDLFIANIMSFGDGDPRNLGCDYAVQFPPHGIEAQEMNKAALGVPENFGGKIFDMAEVADLEGSKTFEFPYFPGLMPRWDNTARNRQRGHVFKGATPKIFQDWVQSAARRTLSANPDIPFMFINAWNEWGEGAILEPDSRWGRRYLEALSRGLISSSQATEKVHSPLADQSKGFHRWLPGVPKLPSDAQAKPAMRMNIDSANLHVLPSEVVLRRGDLLSIRGWIATSSEVDGYLVALLEPNNESGEPFYCAGLGSEPRDDVRMALSGFSSRNYGFTCQTSTADLQPGVYSFVLLEVHAGGLFRASSSLRLAVLS